jgi:endonuclease/exonuclease/phosphatase family metal-dependent hydrolase
VNPSGLTVLTWNVQWFCGLDGVVGVERVLDHARSLADFDVLCLQEVAVNYPGLRGDAGFDQVQRVRELLPDFEVAFGAAVDERGADGRRQRFGNLIATRLPLAQVHRHSLPYPAEAGVPSMPRGCLVATVLAPWGPLRVMTTHLEYYSRRMRMAQARALLELHAQACALAAAPPTGGDAGNPFQAKPHTASALLCGDFNLPPREPEYALLQQAVPAPATRFVDAWTLVHGPATPRAPTFCVHDHEYGEAPYACDFVFASEDLAPRVTRVEVDQATRLSDHQPVRITLS